MRDPMSWSVPLYRLFGITVRLHIIYIIIVLALFLRVWVKSPHVWFEALMIYVVMLFVAILLHEYGHCFAARSVDGDATEILIWPLGGLAYCEVPNTPRAHFITTMWGPGVNFLLAVVCGVAVFSASYMPPLNPFQNPYHLELTNWRDGSTAIGSKDERVVTKMKDGKGGEPIDGERVSLDGEKMVIKTDSRGGKQLVAVETAATTTMPDWVLWTARFGWLNWSLFLLNLLPAFPLDGGRLLQCFLWGRNDFRSATQSAIISSYVVAGVVALVGLTTNESILFALALFIFVFARQQQMILESGMDDSPFGYDFSQGYTSLERDNPSEPKPKKVGPIKRWLQEKAKRRLQREREQRIEEEQRLDDLLAKVAEVGMGGLTEEERRFLQRVSAKKRNRTSPGE